MTWIDAENLLLSETLRAVESPGLRGTFPGSEVSATASPWWSYKRSRNMFLKERWNSIHNKGQDKRSLNLMTEKKTELKCIHDLTLWEVTFLNPPSLILCSVCHSFYKFYILILNPVYMGDEEHMNTERPEEGVRSLSSLGNCKRLWALQWFLVGNQRWSSGRAASPLEFWDISPAPRVPLKG